jgi:DNA-binding transcriptional MerR regulator
MLSGTLEVEMAETSLLPGQLARRAGITQEALRYYERRGLLPAPVRAANGYRRYGPTAVKVIGFIKRAQGMGFTLAEIREFMEIAGNPRAKCTGVCSAIEVKLRELDAQMKALESGRRRLKRLLRSCPGDVPIRECPIVTSLTDGGAPTRAGRRISR